MKNTVYIIVVIAVLGILAIYFYPNQNNFNPVKPSIVRDVSENNKPVDNTFISSTGFKDGEFLGDVSSNRFGNVEVSIIIKNNEIENVKLIQIPNDDSRSEQISQYAVDILIEETLSKQSSDIDTVSGATYTSLSYKDSLQSAIDKARQ